MSSPTAVAIGQNIYLYAIDDSRVVKVRSFIDNAWSDWIVVSGFSGTFLQP